MIIVAIGAIVVVGSDVSLPFFGGDEEPEDVVATYIEALEAEDLAAIEEVLDRNIVVTFDASPIGYTEEIPDEVGRDTVLQNIERDWAIGGLIFDEAIVSSEGDAVYTELTITLPDGSTTRHEVTYYVTAEGRIYQEDHVIVE